MIKGVIFDFGGVVGYGRKKNLHSIVADKVGVSEAVFQSFIDLYYDRSLKGLITRREFFTVIAKEFGFSTKEIEKKYEEALKVQIRIRKPVIALAKKLRGKGYAIAMVSDVGTITAHYLHRNGVYSFFDPLILSSEVKSVKPTRKIYELALRKMNLKGKECVFVDDHEYCLAGARRTGMNTVLFKDVKQLERDLRALGVK